MATIDTGAGGISITNLGIGNVRSVGERPRFSIDLENGLIHGIEQIDVVARLSVQLPQDAIFANG